MYKKIMNKNKQMSQHFVDKYYYITSRTSYLLPPRQEQRYSFNINELTLLITCIDSTNR